MKNRCERLMWNDNRNDLTISHQSNQMPVTDETVFGRETVSIYHDRETQNDSVKTNKRFAREFFFV